MKSDRLESVEILRGLAAFSVMWFHLTNGQPNFLDSGSLIRSSGAYGFLGVPAFFVISGFIIPHALARNDYRLAQDGPRFIVSRIARIQPAYLISALLVVVLQVFSSLAPGSNARAPDTGIFAVLLVHVAYLAPWLDVPWLSPVYWSLAIEFQYYFAMVFLAPLLLSAQRWRVHSVLFATAVLPFVSHDPRTLIHYLPLFGLGFIRFLCPRGVLKPVELVGYTLVFFSLSWLVLGPQYACAAIVAFGFLFIPIREPVPVLSFLGLISYSLYLVHVPIGGRVINLALRLPAIGMLQIAACCCAVSVSLGAAYLFWRFVERPSAAFSKSVGLKRRSATAVADFAATSRPIVLSTGRDPDRTDFVEEDGSAPR